MLLFSLQQLSCRLGGDKMCFPVYIYIYIYIIPIWLFQALVHCNIGVLVLANLVTQASKSL